MGGYLRHDEQHVLHVVGAAGALPLRRAGDVDRLRAHPVYTPVTQLHYTKLRELAPSPTKKSYKRSVLFELLPRSCCFNSFSLSKS